MWASPRSSPTSPRTRTRRTVSARARRSSTRTRRPSRATTPTWTASPTTSSVTPAPRATRRSAPSRRCAPWSTTASTATWTTCSARARRPTRPVPGVPRGGVAGHRCVPRTASRKDPRVTSTSEPDVGDGAQRSSTIDMAPSTPFESVDDVVEALSAQGYTAAGRLATPVSLLPRLEKPLLLEGPAGVGKTELAKMLAAATGRRFLRLQCYEGQDETKALYEWDYGKQLMYTQILREKIGQVVEDAPDLATAVERIGENESVFFSERFLAPRPLLEAIRSEQPVVLLIDEVDRADEALEAVLLETLGEFQISVPEVGTFTATRRPYVLLTSNNTRDLAAALKRRCLHLFLDYPAAERELEIVRSKKTGLADSLAVELVDVVRGLRELELRKAPSISETI